VTRRSQASRALGTKIIGKTRALVLFGLQQEWSPEQISGWMAREHSLKVSHETIYKYIWADKKAGGTLYLHLRHQGKKYNKRAGKNSGRGLIPGRVDITERPAIVEEKTRIGDFEIDTIVGKHHKGAIVSLVDRASKYTKLILVKTKAAEEVSQAIQKALRHIQHRVLTLTADNGKEFAYHKIFGEALDAEVYFATPYHSWERGLNEHTNGLVRQYFPKKTDFATLTQAQVAAVEKKLNTRPRKVLNFNTPENVFFKTNFAA
jgi:IS30 family transposase